MTVPVKRAPAKVVPVKLAVPPVLPKAVQPTTAYDVDTAAEFEELFEKHKELNKKYIEGGGWTPEKKDDSIKLDEITEMAAEWQAREAKVKQSYSEELGEAILQLQDQIIVATDDYESYDCVKPVTKLNIRGPFDSMREADNVGVEYAKAAGQALCLAKSAMSKLYSLDTALVEVEALELQMNQAQGSTPHPQMKEIMGLVTKAMRMVKNFRSRATRMQKNSLDNLLNTQRVRVGLKAIEKKKKKAAPTSKPANK